MKQPVLLNLNHVVKSVISNSFKNMLNFPFHLLSKTFSGFAKNKQLGKPVRTLN